jgi:hypothetical protein
MRMLSLACLLALVAAPAHAATERASIAVSLRVLPSCAARTAKPLERKGPQPLECVTTPAHGQARFKEQPAYAMRTYRSAAGTVVSYDF